MAASMAAAVIGGNVVCNNNRHALNTAASTAAASHCSTVTLPSLPSRESHSLQLTSSFIGSALPEKCSSSHCQAPKKRFAGYDPETGKTLGGATPIAVLLGVVVGAAALLRLMDSNILAFSARSTSLTSRSFVVQAAKLPAGVEAPVEEPKLPVSLWGFTEKAEVWNSRAAMIGIFALVALEFFTHQGILQMIGVDVGKGLDIPL